MKLVSVAFALILATTGCSKKKETPAEQPAPAGSAAAVPAAAPAPAAASGKQACDLIDEAKLGELAGKPLKKGQVTGTGDTSQCGWSPADDNDSGGGVSITYYTGTNDAWKNMSALGGDPAPGIGDEAMADATSIRIRKGGDVANVDFKFPMKKDQLLAVGKEVAAKM